MTNTTLPARFLTTSERAFADAAIDLLLETDPRGGTEPIDVARRTTSRGRPVRTGVMYRLLVDGILELTPERDRAQLSAYGIACVERTRQAKPLTTEPAHG